MKKTIYISLWGVLGIMVSTLLHGAIEIPVIYLIVNKTSILPYSVWTIIHAVFAVLLGGAGYVYGIHYGIKFWEIIYVKKKIKR